MVNSPLIRPYFLGGGGGIGGVPLDSHENCWNQHLSHIPPMERFVHLLPNRFQPDNHRLFQVPAGRGYVHSQDGLNSFFQTGK